MAAATGETCQAKPGERCWPGRAGSEKYLLTLNSIQCINNSYHLLLHHLHTSVLVFQETDILSLQLAKKARSEVQRQTTQVNFSEPATLPRGGT